MSAVLAGHAVAAYNILRAFSWQIRLSPVPFEELCASLFLPQPSPLADEIFQCLLRALAQDENRGTRYLNLNPYPHLEC